MASEAVSLFQGEVNASTEEKYHLGAVTRSKSYKDQYCDEKVSKCEEELKLLSEIAKSYPHSAYIAYTKGNKSKFNYFMRTIESFDEYLDPVCDIIYESLLPTLFSQEEPLPDILQDVITLTPVQGGPGVKNLKEESPQKYAASKAITVNHVNSILEQSSLSHESAEDLKKQQQSHKRAINMHPSHFFDKFDRNIGCATSKYRKIGFFTKNIGALLELKELLYITK